MTYNKSHGYLIRDDETVWGWGMTRHEAFLLAWREFKDCSDEKMTRAQFLLAMNIEKASPGVIASMDTNGEFSDAIEDNDVWYLPEELA